MPLYDTGVKKEHYTKWLQKMELNHSKSAYETLEFTRTLFCNKSYGSAVRTATSVPFANLYVGFRFLTTLLNLPFLNTNASVFPGFI